MLHVIKYMVFSICLLASTVASANISIPMYLTTQQGPGKSIGVVIAKQNPRGGVVLIPDLHGLPPGLHGFHIHENPSCDDNGMAAGGHLDPQHTGKHLGPYEKGHLGDLPVLEVDNQGHANSPVVAPHLRITDLKNHSLMIHSGGDNYSDFPEKMGGGGTRIACGVIK